MSLARAAEQGPLPQNADCSAQFSVPVTFDWSPYTIPPRIRVTQRGLALDVFWVSSGVLYLLILDHRPFLDLLPRKKNKKIYSWRWYMYCDGRVGTGESYIKINIWKKLVGRERLETIRHLSYIQETNGACSRKTCDKQKWERQALCKWPIRVPETHGPALSECRPFPGD